nr:hypothetical protein [Candidatus Enterousia merdequi]
MIKKIFSLVIGFFLCAATAYLDTEQKYFFTSEALIEALQNNVPDEQKRLDAGTVYTKVMNQETGMLSVADLFNVCRAAGFNTYRREGFESCKQFINSLIELEEDALGGFCPGLDENGKNPNALQTITDKTRIGDFCSSTNIYAGEVVFKKGYNCTCLSYACNDGYEFKGGACVTQIADGEGFCVRSDNKIQKDMKLEEAKAFCEDLAKKNKCKYKSAVILHKDLRVLCNATREEIDHAKTTMFEAKEKQKANLKYYEVCDDDKGKSGGQEHCVKGVFNWVNVGQTEAVGLAQEYAKVKNGHDILCAEGYRESYNDDYIKCATADKKHFYEFQFDDVVESIDEDKIKGILKGLAIIYGANYISLSWSLRGTCDSANNVKVVAAAKKYGLKSKTVLTNCLFSYQNVSADSLATIDGLDNRYFYDDVQVQGSQQIEEYLKKYIRNQGITIQSFECEKGYRKLDKKLMLGLKETDDVLRCVLNGKPIDWVFDDLSELSKNRREAGHAGMNCKISGGIYAGKKCHGLSQQQCSDMDAKLKQINPSSAGTVWQNDQCVLIDVQQQNYIDTGVQIGLSVIALADCATVVVGNAQGAMGCTLAVVEITGLATDLGTGAAMQARADEFLENSHKCKEHACALATIRDNAARVISIQDALKSASTATAVDSEIARLIDLLEPSDLQSECTGNCDYEHLITALGGDPTDASGTALKVANKIGFVAQFASLGVSLFRLTGKAIAKLGLRATKAADTAVDVTKAVSNTARALNAADDVSDAAKLASKADDVADAAQAAGKSDDVVDAVWDAAAKRFRDPKTGRFVSGYTSYTDELAEIGIKRTIVDGKDVYKDIKTGAELSDVQVLNRIPTSMNDDFAKIGVRQIEHADGTWSYLDIRAGGGNKFISEAEVLKRIDDMPRVMAGAVDDVADAARVASKADDVADASSVFKKLGRNIDDVVRDAQKSPVQIVASSISDSEMKILEGSLKSKGLEIVKLPGNSSTYGIPQLRISKIGSVADDVADAARVANKMDDVADASSVFKKFGRNIDDVVRDAQKSPVQIAVSSISDSEMKILEGSLKSKGLEIVKLPGNSSTYGMPQLRISKIGSAADDVADAARAARVANPISTKAEKISVAIKNGDLGYHGTDANIAMDDVIRASANTSDQLGSVGYGIAKDYDAAEKYAVKRLIERQNTGKSINFFRENNVLVIKSSEPINLSNKTGYVYTTAKEASVKWDVLQNDYVGAFNAAQMPHSVEILDKTVFNLDDLIRQGKVKLIIPNS